MTWLHRPTSCHDTALSIGTDGHCQFLPEAEPGNAKRSRPKARAEQWWCGQEEGATTRGGGRWTDRQKV